MAKRKIDFIPDICKTDNTRVTVICSNRVDEK